MLAPWSLLSGNSYIASGIQYNHLVHRFKLQYWDQEIHICASKLCRQWLNFRCQALIRTSGGPSSSANVTHLPRPTFVPRSAEVSCALSAVFLQIHTKRIKIISKHVKIDEIMFNCIIFTLPVCGMQCVGLVYVHTRQAPTLELLLHVVSVPTFSRTKCLYVSSIIHIFHRQ